MEERRLKPPTRTYFDAVGRIDFNQEDFIPNQKGKNNPDYIYSRLNFFLISNDQKIKINLIGGFTPKTKIYCFNDKKESIVIDFQDRDNQTLIKQISTINLLQVGVNKIDKPKINQQTQEVVIKDGNPEMIKVWNYQNFLTEYDLINFLGQNIKSGMRVRITGEITYNMYEGKIQRNYKINRIYFLTEEDNFEDRFSLKVDVLLDKNSLNESEIVVQDDNKNRVKISAMIYHQINKNKRRVIPLEIYYIFNNDDKDKSMKIIKKLFEVKGDIIRKISLECNLFNGKIYNEAIGQLELEISDELQALIDGGFITKEEVLKSLNSKNYSEVKFVDEIHFIRPVFILKNGIATLAIDDEQYTKEDLVNLEIIENKKITEDVEDLFSDDDFPF